MNKKTEIITFYSYKGGTGRSLALWNVAILLASKKNCRVGVVDMDVEAAGLQTILKLDLKESGDLLKLINEKTIQPIEDYIIDVEFGKFSGKNTAVFLLPTISDANELDKIKWDSKLYQRVSKDILQPFCNIFKLDFLLIDSRTGASGFSTFALQEANRIILFSRMDRQSKYGMKRMVDICNGNGKPFNLVISGVPKIENFNTELKNYISFVGHKPEVIIPYFPPLYFNETILSFTEPNSELVNKYLEISDLIMEIPKNGCIS